MTTSHQSGISPGVERRFFDAGFTMIELIVVIVITSLVAGFFSQTLVSSIEIYQDHNQRKTAHIDARRSFDMVLHDMREWRDWKHSVEADRLEFERINRFERQLLFFSRIYYDDLKVRYDFDTDEMTYRRDNDGDWSNEYYLFRQGVVPGSSQFDLTTTCGTERITLELRLIINGKPMRIRSTVYPRQQGG